jgi:uncharacterized tellurite resistance protein B-like protein
VVLRRILGLPQSGADVIQPRGRRPAGDDAETETVRRIVGELEAMPADRARFVAGFAYVLARAAHADLHISDEETAEMERIVREHGHLPEAQAVLVVGIAKSHSRLIGATEDYLVTREFVRASTESERLDLLRCCYLVGSADGTISAEETGTLSQIADELQVDRERLTEIRQEFADRMSAVRAMRRRLEEGPRG